VKGPQTYAPRMTPKRHASQATRTAHTVALSNCGCDGGSLDGVCGSCHSEGVIASDFDVAAARAATPGCAERAFLLSAGSSLPTQTTLEAVIGHLRREAQVGGYQAADEAGDVLQQGRNDLAAVVGGEPSEIAYVPSDSIGWVKAWWGWVTGGNVPSGGVVLIDRLTYHSHYAALVQTQAIADFEIRMMPSLPDGTVDLAALDVPDEVSVVCATMIGTHCGNVNPIAEIGAAAPGVPLFVDGCQAIGQLEIDVCALGCHVLTGTGRKFLRGPRGSGVLWVATELIDRFQPPGIDATSTDWTAAGGLSTMPGIGRFEEYEVSYASMVGLASAAHQALDIGMAAIEARVTRLADTLRDGLGGIDGVTVHDTAARRCGIVTFTVAGFEPSTIVEAADRHEITINASTAPWAALDMHSKGLDSVVRASPHYFNTEQELERLIDVVGQLR
jgi:cysteine desulfurase/selenocysteine lyase